MRCLNMTAMTRLRAARIVRMCCNWSHYDPCIVSSPIKDEEGRLHWQVSYGNDCYVVSRLHGEWCVSRVDAFVHCLDGDLPTKDDVMLF